MKSIQVCRVSPYGRQDRDNAAKPQPSFVGVRSPAAPQGCPVQPGFTPRPAQGLCPAAHPLQQRLAGEAAVSLRSQLLFAFPSLLSSAWTLPGLALDPLLRAAKRRLCVPRLRGCGSGSSPKPSDSAVLEPCPALAADGSRPLPTFPFLLIMPHEPLELITVADYRSPGNNASSDNY